MRRTLVGSSFSAVLVAACMLLAALVAAGAPARAGAAVDDPVLPPVAIDAAAERAAAVNPQMLKALQRDLRLSRKQVIELRVKEEAARSIASRVREQFADRYAGAWLSDDRTQVVVAVTDWARAAQVRAAGAKPVRARYGQQQLHAMVGRLGGLPAGIDMVYPDARKNRVVIEVRPGARDAAADFVRARGVDPAAVRMIPSPGPMITTADIRAGDGYDTFESGFVEECSAGFGVKSRFDENVRGFVTAGHCGQIGQRARALNGEGGFYGGSRFPGTDHAWVTVDNPAAVGPFVTDHAGGLIGVIGTRDVLLFEETVCRSGRVTKWRCGLANATGILANVRNSSGTRLGQVSGLVRTSFCADVGDSGGPVIAGQAALGVLSGTREPGCEGAGAASFYQPLAPILESYQLDLLTVQSGPPITPPVQFRINRLFCGPAPRGTGYVVCDATWVGSVDPAIAEWRAPRAPRPPVVTTDPVAKVTTATFNCNNPGGPELTFETQVKITDAIGRTVSSPLTIPCGW